jgi:hypothetical protein
MGKSQRLHLGCGHINRIEPSRVESELAKADSQPLSTRLSTRLASQLDLPLDPTRLKQGDEDTKEFYAKRMGVSLQLYINSDTVRLDRTRFDYSKSKLNLKKSAQSQN